MRTAFALMIGGLSLAGCSTTPMTVDCDPFRTQFTGAVPHSATVTQIQEDVLPPGQALAAEADAEAARAEAYGALVNLTLPNNLRSGQDASGAVLALSGGGQWGAFGAGYLQRLNEKGALPRFRMVTGVSTGALQALFVGASQAPGANTGALLDQLVAEYTIMDEDEVVHRGGYAGALLRGSVAKLDPLRLKIEKALCSKVSANPQTVDDCPLIKALGTAGAPVVMLGFVEARSGEMQAINVSAIAQAAVHDSMSIKDAQQCITGGALASVAMPFFYQQVQVTSDPPRTAAERTLTYYDGGVRQSMFLWETVKAMAMVDAKRLAPAKAYITEADALAVAPPVYMIRNGPTVAKVDKNADRKRDAIPTAERGYSLIVNQSEVTAIEAIRLRNGASEMRVATADGYERPFPGWEATKDEPGGCTKKTDGAMFEPVFMQCLRDLGRYKADDYKGRQDGWIMLTPP